MVLLMSLPTSLPGITSPFSIAWFLSLGKTLLALLLPCDLIYMLHDGCQTFNDCLETMTLPARLLMPPQIAMFFILSLNAHVFSLMQSWSKLPAQPMCE